MRKAILLIVLTMLCGAAMAHAVERAPFSGVVEVKHEMLAGEDFSYKEILKSGEEARGKGAVMFKGVRLDGGKAVAMVGVRSFLDGHFTLFLQQGDMFVSGNRYFKVVRLERPKGGQFAGSHVLTIAVYRMAE